MRGHPGESRFFNVLGIPEVGVGSPTEPNDEVTKDAPIVYADYPIQAQRLRIHVSTHIPLHREF